MKAMSRKEAGLSRSIQRIMALNSLSMQNFLQNPYILSGVFYLNKFKELEVITN
jgi:hypothetical protein